MKSIVYALSTLAIVGVTPLAAQAADLGGYDEGYSDRGPVVERPPVARDYYYDDGPAVAYYAPRYYRPYYAYGYGDPYRYGYWGRPYWRSGYWGGRGYWGYRGGHWGGHRGWR